MVGQVRAGLEDPVALLARVAGRLVRAGDVVPDVEAVLELSVADQAEIFGRLHFRLLHYVTVVLVADRVSLPLGSLGRRRTAHLHGLFFFAFSFHSTSSFRTRNFSCRRSLYRSMLITRGSTRSRPRLRVCRVSLRSRI